MSFILFLSCEYKGTHPEHEMIRISSSSRLYPPHFFTRLSRYVYNQTNGHLVTIMSFLNNGKLIVQLLVHCRLFDRLHQQHYPTSTTKRLNHFGAVEYMAKDLVDEEFDSASDYDTETSLRSSPAVSVTNSIQTVSHGGSNQYHERPESNTEILPSIEELTKSMQDLTERDLVSLNDQESCSKNEVCDELGWNQKELIST